MFWGVVIQQGRRYTQTVEKTYHVSMAVYEAPQETSKCRAKLMCETAGNAYMICSLDNDKHNQSTLDLIFTEGEQVSFYMEGERGSKIHLSGYLVDFDEQEAYFDDDSSLEDEVEAVSKHKLADKNVLPPAKKIKSEPNGDFGNDDSDEDDESFVFDNLNDEEEEEDEEDDEEEEDEDDEESDEDDEESNFFKIKQESVNGAQSKALNETPGKNQKNIDGKQPQSNQKLQQESQPKNKFLIGRNPTPNANKPVGSQFGYKPGQQQKGQNSPGQKFNAGKSNQFKHKGSFTPDQKGNWKQLLGGVTINDTHQGSGPEAKKGKLVHVRYVGKLPNNKEFDRSGNRPFSFKLGSGQVIKGWEVGIEGMKVGGKRMLSIPPKMGYGNRGTGPIPPNSTLNFEIELVSVN